MERYSFTGKGSILIKAGTAGKYGSLTLEENEPIGYFTDVNISVNFATIEKIAAKGTENHLGVSTYDPSVLRIENVKLTDSFQSLLYKKQNNLTKLKTEIKRLTSIDGVLFLPLQNGELLADYIYISNMQKEKITGYTLDKTSGTITGLSDGDYNVFYQISKNAIATYWLDNPMLSNLKAEISIKGNLNDSTGEIVAHFNKLKLLTRPELDFSSSNPFVSILEFGILKDDSPVEINYYALL